MSDDTNGAEASRVRAEEGRVMAEAGRVSAERQRAAYETLRQSAEETRMTTAAVRNTLFELTALTDNARELVHRLDYAVAAAEKRAQELLHVERIDESPPPPAWPPLPGALPPEGGPR